MKQGGEREMDRAHSGSYEEGKWPSPRLHFLSRPCSWGVCLPCRGCSLTPSCPDRQLPAARRHLHPSTSLSALHLPVAKCRPGVKYVVLAGTNGFNLVMPARYRPPNSPLQYAILPSPRSCRKPQPLTIKLLSFPFMKPA